MYLLSQMVFYLFLTFLLGVAVGYLLWQTWGQRAIVAKYNTAELRLARLLAEWQAGVRAAPLARTDAKPLDAGLHERMNATATGPRSSFMTR